LDRFACNVDATIACRRQAEGGVYNQGSKIETRAFNVGSQPCARHVSRAQQDERTCARKML
jgi:hypothetical protein